MSNKISIIIPVYNVEEYIDKCIDSVVNQTYKNLEIILVDDGSTDNSGKKCDEWSCKDSRIKVIHKENGGVSSARNEGLKQVTGDYIGWVDPDDWIEFDMYETLLSEIKKHNVDMVECNFHKSTTQYNPTLHIQRKIYIGKQIARNFLMCRLNEALWNKLYKVELYTDIIFNGRIGEDCLVNNAIMCKANRLVKINYTGYHYFIRNNSAMGNTNNIDEFINMVLKIKKYVVDYDLSMLKYANYFVCRECVLIYNMYGKCITTKQKKKICNMIKECIKNLPLLRSSILEMKIICRAVLISKSIDREKIE